MKKFIAVLLASLTILTFMTCEMDIGDGPITAISISIDQDDNAFNIGDTKHLSVTFEPSNATNKALTWQTSNEEVATVDSNGLGTATITATANNNISSLLLRSCPHGLVQQTPHGLKQHKAHTISAQVMSWQDWLNW